MSKLSIKKLNIYVCKIQVGLMVEYLSMSDSCWLFLVLHQNHQSGSARTKLHCWRWQSEINSYSSLLCSQTADTGQSRQRVFGVFSLNLQQLEKCFILYRLYRVGPTLSEHTYTLNSFCLYVDNSYIIHYTIA